MRKSKVYYHPIFDELVLDVKTGKTTGTTEGSDYKFALHFVGDYPRRQWIYIGRCG